MERRQPAVPAEPTVDLVEAANQLNAWHEEIRALLQTPMERAVQIGGLLSQVKLTLKGKRGEYGRWLKANVHFSKRAAENYKRLYDAYKNANVAQMGVAEGLRLLAKPKDESDAGAPERDEPSKGKDGSPSSDEESLERVCDTYNAWSPATRKRFHEWLEENHGVVVKKAKAEVPGHAPDGVVDWRQPGAFQPASSNKDKKSGPRTHQ